MVSDVSDDRVLPPRLVVQVCCSSSARDREGLRHMFPVMSSRGWHVALGWPVDSAASTLGAGNTFEHVVYLSIGLSAAGTKSERCARGAGELAPHLHCLQGVR